MAYYRLEPFGEAIADLRHGIATATLANINRAAKRDPYLAEDFIPWKNKRDPDGPVLLDDPEAQSALIKKLIFKAN